MNAITRTHALYLTSDKSVNAPRPAPLSKEVAAKKVMEGERAGKKFEKGEKGAAARRE